MRTMRNLVDANEVCDAEEASWLMEWAVFLLIVLAFGIAAAYRWAATSTKKGGPQ